MTARPTFIAWRTGRNFGEWHIEAEGTRGLRTVCGCDVNPKARISTTRRPATMCTNCCTAASAQLAAAFPVSGGAAVARSQNA